MAAFSVQSLFAALIPQVEKEGHKALLLSGGGRRARSFRRDPGTITLSVQKDVSVEKDQVMDFQTGVSENLQLGNRPFYDLFAVVIGCGWSCAGAARLHGLFPDFPGEFPPAFCFPRASPPLFLTFVSAEVGSSRRLRDCGVCRGLGSRPAPDLGPPPLTRSAQPPLRSWWGARRGRAWKGPWAPSPPPARTPPARSSRPARGDCSRAIPARLLHQHEPVSASESARSRAAPSGLQQTPRPTAACSSAPFG
ncbi:hypothetical protein H8958_021080 [Nasalis larvatus]